MLECYWRPATGAAHTAERTMRWFDEEEGKVAAPSCPTVEACYPPRLVLATMGSVLLPLPAEDVHTSGPASRGAEACHRFLVCALSAVPVVGTVPLPGGYLLFSTLGLSAQRALEHGVSQFRATQVSTYWVLLIEGASERKGVQKCTLGPGAPQG